VDRLDRTGRKHLALRMTSQGRASPLSVVAPVASLTRRAVAIPMRPVATVTTAAVQVSVEFQLRAIERALASPELDRMLTAAINSESARAAIRRVLESDAAKQLVASLFEAGLFDQLVDRLLASEGFWQLVDEVAVSPAVTAAVTQQGLGFAEQFGDQVRAHSRGADDLLERAARRLARRRAQDPASSTQGPASGVP
jgi:hypothetical protein